MAVTFSFFAVLKNITMRQSSNLLPFLDLLNDYSDQVRDVSCEEEIESKMSKITMLLQGYGIEIERIEACPGPRVTLYKLFPAKGVRVSAIKRMEDCMASNLGFGLRMVTLEDSLGIEIKNDEPSILPLKSVLKDNAFLTSEYELPVALGYSFGRKVKIFDLAKAPHLLVAGATKQGKTVCLNVLIASLFCSKRQSDIKFVFIDPKMYEFTPYAHLPDHYFALLPHSDENKEMDSAIVHTPDRADKVLCSLCAEMELRYELLSKASARNVKAYNEKYRDDKLSPDEGHRFLPYIVTIIDEYADLAPVRGSYDARALARGITASILRLAQKGRAVGLHLVLSTQRPPKNVITGLIKANFPTRIAFRVVSKTDSSTIIDSCGAEKLTGSGDMLYYTDGEMERVQCAYVSSEDINRLTEYICSQDGYKKSHNAPYYLQTVDDDTEEGPDGLGDMTKLD